MNKDTDMLRPDNDTCHWCNDARSAELEALLDRGELPAHCEACMERHADADASREADRRAYTDSVRAVYDVIVRDMRRGHCDRTPLGGHAPGMGPTGFMAGIIADGLARYLNEREDEA